jgi:tRNA nucleotidyltransferase (CCA-adding enzyme)
MVPCFRDRKFWADTVRVPPLYLGLEGLSVPPALPSSRLLCLSLYPAGQLRKSLVKIYMVGGAVRDLLKGVTPKDTDYVVVGSSPEAMIAKGFTQVGADFPVFLHPVTHDEYALARTERKSGTGYGGFVTNTEAVTLEEDLSRRDLTINAMAMDAEFDLVDPYGGKADLEAKVLRHVSPSFAEDPLRVLRVARFMARFGPDWNIDDATFTLMQQMVADGALDELSRERVWVEIEKGLGEEFPDMMLEILDILKVFHRPAFAEYAGARKARHDVLRKAASEEQPVVIMFALAFPRQWSSDEVKDSRVPKHVRDVSHCLQLGLSKGLGDFRALDPAAKVEVLATLDAFRQSDRMINIIKALNYTHSGLSWPIVDALTAISEINKAKVIAGITNGREIQKKLELARIEAVAAL